MSGEPMGVPAPRADPPPGDRSSRLLRGGARSSGLRGNLVALSSAIVVFGGLGYLIVNAPNWPAVQQAFLSPAIFATTLPGLVQAFIVNIQLFLIAELLILPCGLLVAVMRRLPGPGFFPARLFAVSYADLFRAVPGILVIGLLGFGMPALGITWMPSDPFFWGVISLVLLYSAYVSEVYRAGIESVHPSQDAAARSLGLSRAQSLRYVVIPQAVRRVIPPLLNDFIGLQKDTALVATIGVVEVFRQGQIDETASFNFTPYVGAAVIFIIVTVPLARFTDWLVARDRRRQLAGAAA